MFYWGPKSLNLPNRRLLPINEEERKQVVGEERIEILITANPIRQTRRKKRILRSVMVVEERCMCRGNSQWGLCPRQTDGQRNRVSPCQTTPRQSNITKIDILIIVQVDSLPRFFLPTPLFNGQVLYSNTDYNNRSLLPGSCPMPCIAEFLHFVWFCRLRLRYYNPLRRVGTQKFHKTYETLHLD